jgi:hypothetical protein
MCKTTKTSMFVFHTAPIFDPYFTLIINYRFMEIIETCIGLYQPMNNIYDSFLLHFIDFIWHAYISNFNKILKIIMFY